MIEEIKRRMFERWIEKGENLCRQILEECKRQQEAIKKTEEAIEKGNTTEALQQLAITEGSGESIELAFKTIIEEGEPLVRTAELIEAEEELEKTDTFTPKEFIDAFKKFVPDASDSEAAERFRKIIVSKSIHHAGITAKIMAIRADAAALEGFTLMDQYLPIPLTVPVIEHLFEQKREMEKLRKPLIAAERKIKEERPFKTETVGQFIEYCEKNGLVLEKTLGEWNFDKEQIEAIIMYDQQKKEEKKQVKRGADVIPIAHGAELRKEREERERIGGEKAA